MFVMALALAVGLAVACVKHEDRQISAESRLVESYAVFSTLINSFPAGEEGKLVLIASKTRSSYPVGDKSAEIEFIKLNIPAGTTKETLDDYKSENRQPQELTSRFGLYSR